MGMRYVKKDDTKKEGTDMQSIKTYVTVSEISMIVQELWGNFRSNYKTYVCNIISWE